MTIAGNGIIFLGLSKIWQLGNKGSIVLDLLSGEETKLTQAQETQAVLSQESCAWLQYKY